MKSSIYRPLWQDAKHKRKRLNSKNGFDITVTYKRIKQNDKVFKHRCM
ncbi:MAG: hypothetical protein ACK5V4_04020 [Alphaproteobacteria bacterium]